MEHRSPATRYSAAGIFEGTAAIVLVPLTWSIARSLWKLDVGVDTIALVAIVGALAVGEEFAAAVVSPTLAGGNALEEPPGRPHHLHRLHPPTPIHPHSIVTIHPHPSTDSPDGAGTPRTRSAEREGQEPVDAVVEDGPVTRHPLEAPRMVEPQLPQDGAQ